MHRCKAAGKRGYFSKLIFKRGRQFLPPFNYPFMETIPVHYQRLKAKYPDAILLFRNGDNYEAFGDDAKTCSDVTETTLINNPEKAGIEHLASLPFHALDAALRKLVKKGYKVAICEELKET